MLNLIYNMTVTGFVFVGLNTFLLHFCNHFTDLKTTWQEVITWYALPGSCEVWYDKLKFKHRLQRKNRKYINQSFQVHISCYTPLHQLNFPMGLFFPSDTCIFKSHGNVTKIPIEHFLFSWDFYFSMRILFVTGLSQISSFFSSHWIIYKI